MAIDPTGNQPGSTLATDAEREDVREVADMLARKWHLAVLTWLREGGPYRFNELKRELGVSSKVLTDCLGELVDADLVDRTVYSQSPPHVEYDLTDQGYELHGIAGEMAAWTNETTDTPPTVLIVDAAVSTNVRFSKWLADGYSVERVSDTAHLDQERLETVDAVVYHHHPLLDDRTDLVDRLNDDSLDVGVVHVTAHRQSATQTQGRAVELVDPVLEGELLQAVQTVLETGETGE